MTKADEMKSSELNEMMWRNSGMNYVGGENGINPGKNLPGLSFVHHGTHME